MLKIYNNEDTLKGHRRQLDEFLKAMLENLNKTKYYSVQSLSHIQLFATPWTTAHQASLSITNSRSLLKLMFIALVMPSNHLILCHPLSLCFQSFPASGSFPMSWFFTSGDQILEFQLQHQYFWWIFRTNFL